MTIIQCAAHDTSGDMAENQEPPPSGRHNIHKAQAFYCMDRWSQNTLSINAQGHVSLKINSEQIDLYQLAKQLMAEKQWPVLLRFPALITKNILAIQAAFAQAIEKKHYQNQYTLAYPLKVNPHVSVVKTMMQSADNLTFEVGSKAELLVALTYTTHEQRIMCNGFKDIHYLALVLAAAQAGQQLCLVFETLDEVSLLMQLLSRTSASSFSDNLCLGLRLRLSTPVAGHWEDSNGQHAKFGLSSTEALNVVHILKKHHYLSHLKAMHIHPGSQILAISELSACFQEAVRYYHELLKLHAPIQYVDIGGGLAMDYSGAAEETLRDYTLEDYAMAIIAPMAEYCHTHQLPHPHILSETGRNTVALSSMLLTNIQPLGALTDNDMQRPIENTHSKLRYLQQLWELQPCEAAQEQQDFLLQNIQKAFSDNQLSWSDLAWAENIYAYNQHCMKKLQKLSNNSPDYQKYIANFSVFQSIPDYWGIQQFFPILSLHGYEYPLTRAGVFYDLTCDSDGVVKHYLHPEKIQSTLSMPDCPVDNPVELMGVFLMGAYQEIMASGHNLFEKLPCLDVTWNTETQSFETHAYEACNIADSLAAIDYNKTELIQRSQNKFGENAIHDVILQQLASTSYLSV